MLCLFIVLFSLFLQHALSEQIRNPFRHLNLHLNTFGINVVVKVIPHGICRPPCETRRPKKGQAATAARSNSARYSRNAIHPDGAHTLHKKLPRRDFQFFLKRGASKQLEAWVGAGGWEIGYLEFSPLLTNFGVCPMRPSLP